MARQAEAGFSRGMVVVAHADDAEWGCGGTVAGWCADGWEAVYVVCTDGSKGSPDPAMRSEELVKIREEEQRAAGRALGLSEVVFSGFSGRVSGADAGAAEGDCAGDPPAPAGGSDQYESGAELGRRRLCGSS